jgi:hypothetical protein
VNNDTVVIGVGSKGQIIYCALRVQPLMSEKADQSERNKKNRFPEVAGRA